MMQTPRVPNWGPTGSSPCLYPCGFGLCSALPGQPSLEGRCLILAVAFSPVLEVHQFAQEAVVAESWLSAQERLVNSNQLGNSVDEVEQLIKRHEAFRKAAAAWEERFSSLRRLTTVGPNKQGTFPNMTEFAFQTVAGREPAVMGPGLGGYPE
ncbi:hypothetical protein chiPu_0024860 [Chiloscyllium punctatum]|uniref:Uncharacterized protein n=1 Tax=Chiloscyllium punctatum TaxID=137246 RepID=A0A401TD44_CHIPU|nr:hypothetical protein [Chiloscyllium punctatum]